MRPSGATAIAVGLTSPVATRVSVNPAGNVAAPATDNHRTPMSAAPMGAGSGNRDNLADMGASLPEPV
jgi:hypothetical protein